MNPYVCMAILADLTAPLQMVLKVQGSGWFAITVVGSAQGGVKVVELIIA